METAEYEIMFGAEDTHWWYQALHEIIFSELETFVPEWRGKRILDAGCGTGAILARLGNGSHRGIDLSPEAIKFCHARGLRNVTEGNILELPFEDGTFDAIICSSVLYHRWVEDVPSALKELHRVLKPGSVLLVNLPAHSFLHSKHDEVVFTARRFTRKQTRSLLHEAGFRILRINYWTTFLFPVAYLARTLRLSAKGRDFGSHSPSSFRSAFIRYIMQTERWFYRRMPFPCGVALFATAVRR